MVTVTNRRSVMTLFADPKDLQGHSVRLVLMEKDINVEINYVTDENKPEDTRPTVIYDERTNSQPSEITAFIIDGPLSISGSLNITA